MSRVSYQFDDETALEQVGEHRWRTHLVADWNIGVNPNGGYLLAPLQRAMGQASGHPDPLSVTTHYLRPGSAGPAEIEVEVVRTGRTIGTVRGRLIQDGKTRLESLGAFSDLANPVSVATVSIDPVDLPPPEECVSRAALAQGVEIPLLNRVEVRVHPDHADAQGGRSPEISGWIRFSDGRPVDAAALSLFADAFPPPLFALLGRIGWVPTIELTVQFRRQPVEGWIRGHFATTDVAGTKTIEDAMLWDESGTLVAQARQCSLILQDGTP